MFPTRLLAWVLWWRRPRSAAHLCFVLYTRRGCHLCELAKQQLAAARQRHAFHLEEIDVDTRPGLAEQYGSVVPVVTIDGKVRFRGAINQALLDRLLIRRAGICGP